MCGVDYTVDRYHAIDVVADDASNDSRTVCHTFRQNDDTIGVGGIVVFSGGPCGELFVRRIFSERPGLSHNCADAHSCICCGSCDTGFCGNEEMIFLRRFWAQCLHNLKNSHIFAPEINKMVRLAQLVRASDCGSEGQGFETLISPHSMRLPQELLEAVFFVSIPGKRLLKAGCRQICMGHSESTVVEF